MNGRLYANYPNETIPISAIIGLTGMNGYTGPTGPQGPQGPSNSSAPIKYDIIQYYGNDETTQLNPVSQYVFLNGNNNLNLPTPSQTWAGVQINARIIDNSIISRNSIVVYSSGGNVVIASGQGTIGIPSIITVSSLSASFICDGTYWVQFP